MIHSADSGSAAGAFSLKSGVSITAVESVCAAVAVCPVIIVGIGDTADLFNGLLTLNVAAGRETVAHKVCSSIVGGSTAVGSDGVKHASCEAYKILPTAAVAV